MNSKCIIYPFGMILFWVGASQFEIDNILRYSESELKWVIIYDIWMHVKTSQSLCVIQRPIQQHLHKICLFDLILGSRLWCLL